MDKKLKMIVGALAIVLLGALLVFGLAQASPVYQTDVSEANNQVSTVAVSGNGQVQAIPDVGVIRLGVETQAESAQDALSQNSEQTQSVIDAVKDAEIPPENIRTETIRLTPRYEYDDTHENRTLVGYVASNFIKIETNDLETLGILLDQAVKAGATNIESIRFDISDVNDLVEQARQVAVENAFQKAEQLADLTGATLNSVLEIRESSSLPGPVVAQVEQVAADAAASAVPIEPGSQTVQVNVQITWILNTGQ